MDNKVATLKNPKYEVPIWHKSILNIEEAMAYTGIGRDKLREMTDSEDCPYILWVGNRRFIKRKVFDECIRNTYSV